MSGGWRSVPLRAICTFARKLDIRGEARLTVFDCGRGRAASQICWGELGWPDIAECKEGDNMFRMLLHWILNAVALLLVSHFVSGFVVSDFASAMIAVVVIGLLNATFGLFFLVINAMMLKFASGFIPGFRVETFGAAFLGALALAVLHLLFGFLTPKRRRV